MNFREESINMETIAGLKVKEQNFEKQGADNLKDNCQNNELYNSMMK